MRFLDEGPSLPDELLVARDEGNVLFFCGAGVSQARARLPGFFALAERVLDNLRSLPDSPARQLVETAKALQERPIFGVGSVLAADRVFGLLENEFALSDIENKIGAVLKPEQRVDLTAHKTLIDLSRTESGDVQLVTTNFDRLFQAAAPKAKVWTPDNLPDLARSKSFQGIVHLHGMFDSDYCRSIGGRLVLSGAEFGRAYLAEGWATRFIRDAIASYTIVFIGYSADDPPVQYLLEALARGSESGRGIYAFQEGREDFAKARWSQKGVTVFPYSAENGHSALWRTLEAWAERARDPAKWRSRIIRGALKGPEQLKRYERGQVVHLAMTNDGARDLAQAKRTIPATWLGAFDPEIRYGTPGPRELFRQGSLEVDPFVLFGVDADAEPPPRNPNDMYKRRDVPRDALDVFSPTIADHIGARSVGFRSLNAELPTRFVSLSMWLGRVCDQPAAIWWAAGQRTLHPRLIERLEFHVSRCDRPLSLVARTAWRYVLTSRRGHDDAYCSMVYAVKERIEREGWTPLTRREFESVGRPEVTVERPLGAGPSTKKARVSDVVRLNVQYADDLSLVAIPDVELTHVVPILRRNLEIADELEDEVSPYFRGNIPSLERGEDRDSAFAYEAGFNKRAMEFTHAFERLVRFNRDAAIDEANAWPRTSEVFERLRMWAAGLDGFWDAVKVGETFVRTTDEVFWNGRAQRDVLLVLARRWNALPDSFRHTIEQRLLKGRPRWRRENLQDHGRRRASLTLERLQWMRGKGCVFSFDLETTKARLQKLAPEWTEERSVHAIDDMSSRGGYVRTDEVYDELNDVPLNVLIETALRARRHEFGSLREFDPFSGLCRERPVRVLLALKHVKDSEISRIAWTHFLQFDGEARDRDKLSALIARRLTLLPDEILLTIGRPAASWFARCAERVFKRDIDGAHKLFDRLLRLVSERPNSDLAGSLMQSEDRWFDRAWNSFAGDLIAALSHDPTLSNIPLFGGLPQEWTRRAEAILALPPDHNRFALVRLVGNLSWLFSRDATWTERHLLSALDGRDYDREVFIAGFFGNPKIAGEELFARLKPILLELSNANGKASGSYVQPLSGLLSSAWLNESESGCRWLTDEEFRVALVRCSPQMRGSVLWHVTQWTKFEDKLYFLVNVWPLQLSVRSPSVTSRLCDVAFSDEENFPKLVTAIIPHLTTLDGGSLHSLSHGKGSKLIERYPLSVVDLMNVILPRNATKHPHGAEVIWERLTKK